MSKKKSFSADHISVCRSTAHIVVEEEVPARIEKPKDYKKELTFYFYNAMLNCIVKDWDTYVNDTTESISSGDEVICSKPYEPYVEGAMEEEPENDIPETPVHMRHSRRLSTLTRSSIGGNRLSDITSVTDLRKSRKGGLQRRSFPKIKLKKKTMSRKSTRNNPIETIKIELSDVWIIKSEKENVEITFMNGNKYKGELYRKIMHGTGQFTWADGTTYTGNFENGQMTGRGRIEYPDKSVYEGEMYKGYIHGRGNEYKSYNNSFYNGEYFLSAKHGNGRMMFDRNNYYDGPWNMNTREGKGFRHYNDDFIYYGDWVNGKRHGLGTAILNNDFYQGEWCNGEKHGYGEYVWDAFLNNFLSIPVQNKYCGLWDHDYIHGFGLLYFGTEGGARYAGVFYRNIKHGPGIVVCNNGKVIKADPLFINDKAVRRFKEMKKSPKKGRSFSDSRNLNTDYCSLLTCSNLEPQIYPISPEHELREQNLLNLRKFIFPCYGFEKSTIAKINSCRLIHNTSDYNMEMELMSIDLNSSERIDLKKIINEVAAKYLYVLKNTHNKENTSSIKERYFKELQIWPCLLPEHFCEDYVFDRFNKYKECENFFVLEEERIRKTIRKNLHYFLDLYDYYAFVSSIHERPAYKGWMMRIYLWQLFMDCKMPQKDITLHKIDEIMAEYSPITVADIHNPFDIIYFWQFLTCLVVLAWKLYGNDFVNIKTNGILEKAFTKFLTNDIFPNAKKHIGSALFEYRDIIPITAAYQWYKSFGPKFTVYQFLKYSSSLQRNVPPEYYKELGVKIPLIKHGQNIAYISDKIIYRKVESYVIGNHKYNFSEIYAHEHGYYLKSLKYLFLLGGRRVLNILKEICPMIAVQDEYINMNHELSFLEFYEAVLRCTQQKVIEDAKLRGNDFSDVKSRKTIFHYMCSKAKAKYKSRKSNRYKPTEHK